jgi:calmodulin
MHYYNLDSKKNRRSQHEHFEKNRCGYRKFIPIKFTNNECEHPRLALEDISAKEKLTTGMTYKLKEICTKEDARLSGQTTMMKVFEHLYYIEIVFKEGKVSKCYPRPGATPDWFCNPRKIEIEKEKVLIELEKEKVIQAKKEKALVLIAREREKVLEEAKLKGDKIKEQAKIAVQKKIKLEEEEEEQKVLIEIEKQKIRVFNARRAEVERQFTRVQLEALREQFDEADADNSDSIDANELMAVCRSLGENLSMKQVKALIAEVDDDGSGEIEWEEYLIIMGKKRKDAMKKGSGLFQKMSMRSDAASIKKDEQIRKRLKENEEKSKLAAIDREKKKNKADKRKAKEKKMILKKNPGPTLGPTGR